MRETTMYGQQIINRENYVEALEKINEGVFNPDKKLSPEDLGFIPPGKMSFDNTEVRPDEAYVIIEIQ